MVILMDTSPALKQVSSGMRMSLDKALRVDGSQSEEEYVSIPTVDSPSLWVYFWAPPSAVAMHLSTSTSKAALLLSVHFESANTSTRNFLPVPPTRASVLATAVSEPSGPLSPAASSELASHDFPHATKSRACLAQSWHPQAFDEEPPNSS